MANEEKTAVSCLLALWALCVTSPMWLVLLFAMAQACQLPTWAWVLYWCYVPAHILGLAMATLAKLVVD